MKRDPTQETSVEAQDAEYVVALRQVAEGICSRESFERLGMKSHCYHCYAVRRLRQIDGSGCA